MTSMEKMFEGLKLKVSLIKSNENELNFEIQDEGHTLLNLLQKTILANKDVEIAGYDIPHRLVNKAVFYVKTKKQEASKVVIEAIKTIKDNAEEFKKTFAKALKEQG